MLVIAIESGRVVDSGGGHNYPDLASVGPVITDYRCSGPVKAQRMRRVLLHAHRRRVIARARRLTARRGPVELHRRGAVTVGSPGRARLHERDGGMSQLIWDVLEQAGWLGCAAGLRPALELHIRVAPACGIRQPAAPRFTPLPGGQRRHGDRFLVEDDGRIRAAYVGPLHARAVTGIRLVDSERRAEDFD